MLICKKCNKKSDYVLVKGYCPDCWCELNMCVKHGYKLPCHVCNDEGDC